MFSLTVIALLLTIALLVGLTAVALYYRRKQGAVLFALLQAVSAAWASLTVLGLTMSPGTVRLRIWGLTSGLSLLVIILWFGFILSYIGQSDWLTGRRLGVVSVPLLIGASVYFVAPTWTPLVGQLSQETIPAGTVVTASIGPVGIVLGAYIYLVFLSGLVLVVKTVVEGSRLFVGQALAFVVGSLITIVASFFVILGIPVAGYPLTQVALGGQALLWGYAVFGQQLLRVVPAVAEIGEQTIFEDLDDGILVVNEDGIVVRANPQARRHLDLSDPTGDAVEPILGSMAVSSIQDLPARFERDGRTYRTEASGIRNWQGEQIGHALVVRDITPLVTREQRLAVLNRILRHNVRNDMSIVLGVGSRLQNREEADLAASGERLRRTARDLTRVSEKAIEVSRLFDEPIASERVHLPTMIEDLVSTLAGDYPRATVDTAVGADTIRTDPRTLSRVVEEVVANALEHDGDAPTVRIEVTGTAGGVEIAVADDGPGIPQAELDPIIDGDETALKHASSFGLWFVTWGVQALGGDVDISTSATGTEVRLTVPDSETSDSVRMGDLDSALVE